jgi:uncharacterized protein YjdB
LLAGVGLGCTGLFDLDRIAALDILGSTAPSLIVGDTMTLRAQAVTARGAIVPDASIRWRRIDADTGAAVVALDTATGFVTALAPGSASVIALVEDLASGTVRITVSETPPP